MHASAVFKVRASVAGGTNGTIITLPERGGYRGVTLFRGGDA